MRGTIKRAIAETLVALLVCLIVDGSHVKAQSNISEAIERLAQARDDQAAEKLIADHPDWVMPEIAAGALQKAQAIISTDFKQSVNYARVALRLSIKLDETRLKVRSLYLLALGDMRAG